MLKEIKETKDFLTKWEEGETKCNHRGGDPYTTETDLQPGDFLYSKWKRKVEGLKSLFGKEKCKHSDFQADSHSTFYSCDKCGKSLLIENVPSPTIVESCERVMEYHNRKLIETNFTPPKLVSVEISKADGTTETVKLDPLGGCDDTTQTYTEVELKNIIREIVSINPESIPKQYIETVNILTNNAFDAEYTEELIESVMNDIGIH
jgi:hypothetical protein